MKYVYGGAGTRGEFADYIRTMIPQLFSGKLVVEGKNVVLPTDLDLDYKVKYDETEEGASLAVKVSWDNRVEEEEEVEVDVD